MRPIETYTNKKLNSAYVTIADLNEAEAVKLVEELTAKGLQ